MVSLHGLDHEAMDCAEAAGLIEAAFRLLAQRMPEQRPNGVREKENQAFIGNRIATFGHTLSAS